MCIMGRMVSLIWPLSLRWVYIVDLTDLFFLFVVYFIRANLWGASLGARLSRDMDRS